MKKVITIILAGLVLSSCGVYKKYQSQNEAPADLYGTGDSITKAASEASIAEISWREFFTDPLLQQLIDSALAQYGHAVGTSGSYAGAGESQSRQVGILAFA